MAGVISTTQTFTTGDNVTSTSLNAIATGSSFTPDAITGTTLAITTGKLKVGTITSAEIGTSAVVTNGINDGAVTASKINSAVIFVPSGAVMAFAMNSAPSGWLSADGSYYSKTDSTYLALFTAIGVTYGETNSSGGTGTTHFKVPDLRGYFVRGSGTNSDGTIAGTFGAKQADDIKSHKHSIYSAAGDAPDSGAGAGYGISNDFDSPSIPSGTAVLRTNALGPPTGTGITNVETRPKNIPMLYCIKI
jgi:microcystin-dependent protein